MSRHYRDQWPKLKREIDQAIREVHRQGFCIVMGLWQPDINAVAVPLVCHDRSEVLSIGCAGSAQYLPPRRLEKRSAPVSLISPKDSGLVVQASLSVTYVL